MSTKKGGKKNSKEIEEFSADVKGKNKKAKGRYCI